MRGAVVGRLPQSKSGRVLVFMVWSHISTGKYLKPVILSAIVATLVEDCGISKSWYVVCSSKTNHLIPGQLTVVWDAICHFLNYEEVRRTVAINRRTRIHIPGEVVARLPCMKKTQRSFAVLKAYVSNLRSPQANGWIDASYSLPSQLCRPRELEIESPDIDRRLPNSPSLLCPSYL